MGRATTETKYTEVLYGSGSVGGGFPRLGDHAPMRCILHNPSRLIRSYHCIARDGCVRSSGSSSRGIRERGAPRRGVASSPLWSPPKLALVSVMVTGDLDGSSIARSELLHAILCQIYGVLESAAKTKRSDCPTPTPEQTSTGSCRSFSSHCKAQEAAALEMAQQEHMEMAAARAVPAERAIRRPPSNLKDTGTEAQRQNGS